MLDERVGDGKVRASLTQTGVGEQHGPDMSTAIVSSQPARLEWLVPVRQEMSEYRRILLTFADVCILEEVLGPVLEMVKIDSAELILLRLRPVPNFASFILDEQLFSELRGVQAQLNRWQVRGKVDTVIGPSARAITDYARQNNVDLIIMAGQDEKMGGRSESMVHKVARRAHCDTAVIN